MMRLCKESEVTFSYELYRRSQGSESCVGTPGWSKKKKPLPEGGEENSFRSVLRHDQANIAISH